MRHPRRRFSLPLVLTLLLALGLPLLRGPVALAAGTISGTVFEDHNDNGALDTGARAVDQGIGGVAVSATYRSGAGPDGLLDTPDDIIATVSTTSCVSAGNPSAFCTAANVGAYQLGIPGSATQVRVEAATPAGFQPTAIGATSASTVRFVDSSASPSNLNFGVFRPTHYCQDNPTVLVSCFVVGDQKGDANANGTNGEEDTLFSFNYESSGTADPSKTKVFRADAIGSSWGVAHRQATGVVYAAAMLKRHTDFGPGGTGAIYARQLTSAAPPAVITIPNTGTNPHPTSFNRVGGVCTTGLGSTYTPAGPAQSCYFHDPDAWPLVYKMGLGDVDALEDDTDPANDLLFTVNLNDRQLYKITNLDSAAPTVAPFPLPLALPNTGAAALPTGTGTNQHQGCALSDVRPFALAFNAGQGYLGIVCSAESTQLLTNLRGYVYHFDPLTVTFDSAPIAEFGFGYPRGKADAPLSATWRPWLPVYNKAVIPNTGANPDEQAYPQPIISDITFDDQGFMYLGIRDRFGDQMGTQIGLPDPTDAKTYLGIAAGDTLCAAPSGGTWTLESGGSCGGRISVGSGTQSANQGPGNQEFFGRDAFLDGPNFNTANTLFHEEVGLGGLLHVPGYDEVMVTAYDVLYGAPLSYDTGGVRRFRTADGEQTGAFQLIKGTGTTPGTDNSDGLGQVGLFGKAGGLGDVEVACNAAPIEVGNRIWQDLNGNGLQDPTEPPFAGVTVHLYGPGGALLGTAVTDANGVYSFSNDAARTSTANQVYGIIGLTPTTTGFTIKLDNPADYAPGGALDGWILTQALAGGGANATIDSNAQLNGAPVQYPSIDVSTGRPGSNNHTYDVGLWQPFSLGNRVWFDADNNGQIDGSEIGVNGVTVELLQDDGSGTFVPTGKTLVTSGGGYYRFDGLLAGRYQVRLPASNFTGAGPLVGYSNSTPTVDTASNTQDNRDNGINTPNPQTLGVLSGVATLGPGNNAPTGELDPTAAPAPGESPDARSNRTVDFGFYKLSMGNQLWFDANRDGKFDVGELPVVGARVELRDQATNALIGTATTDGNGRYLIDRRTDGGPIPPGTYYVTVPGGQPPLNGYVPTPPVSLGIDSQNNGVRQPDDSSRSRAFTLTPGSTSGGALVNTPTATTINPTLDFGFVPTGVTAIALTSFGAQPDGAGTLVRWSTAAERGTVGYRVLRSNSGLRRDAVAVSGLVPAVGGGAYAWRDAERGAAYWLVELEANGGTTEYGPARVGLSVAGSVVYLPSVGR